jgi:UDP-3-O-[3-hydroxymyristoyl] glucosamine N-acyltransferase
MTGRRFLIWGAGGHGMVVADLIRAAGLDDAPRLVHPASVASPSARVGPATLVGAGAVVNAAAAIGAGVIGDPGARSHRASTQP